jgi:hypothetical protein
VGHALLAGLIVVCDVALWRLPARSPETVIMHECGGRIGMRDRMRWGVLALAPSSLLLGVTTYLGRLASRTVWRPMAGAPGTAEWTDNFPPAQESLEIPE